jgi:hypothetical protein
MPDKSDFSQEDLDRMYDEAMAWQPPSSALQMDPRAVLQKLTGREPQSSGLSK